VHFQPNLYGWSSLSWVKNYRAQTGGHRLPTQRSVHCQFPMRYYRPGGSLDLILINSSSFVSRQARLRRKVHFGTRSRHTPSVVRSRPGRPQRWATVPIEREMIYLTSGMSHPMPAASVAQMMCNSPVLKSCQHRILAWANGTCRGMIRKKIGED